MLVVVNSLESNPLNLASGLGIPPFSNRDRAAAGTLGGMLGDLPTIEILGDLYAGTHHGYFTETQDAEVIETIRGSAAQIVMVGMAAPGALAGSPPGSDRRTHRGGRGRIPRPLGRRGAPLPAVDEPAQDRVAVPAAAGAGPDVADVRDREPAVRPPCAAQPPWERLTVPSKRAEISAERPRRAFPVRPRTCRSPGSGAVRAGRTRSRAGVPLALRLVPLKT
jgi:hypothetical protein